MTDTFSNRITSLFNIRYPIIQGGMVWVSGWKLASAVSNAGGLGLIGSGSMYPDVLKEHIQKCKAATDKPFGVNLPIFSPSVQEHVKTIIEEKVPIVFTSAGNPAIYTQQFKEADITVVHVVSSSKFAVKAQQCGCDAVVAEGFEAGGHNGREETTTMVLTPLVCDAVTIPVIAAGGIATGRQMAAAMMLGAEGVQMGSRFVLCKEASSHENFKNAVIQSKEGDTQLILKQLTAVRLLKNKFYQEVQHAENRCASKEELQQLLGSGRAKLGMFEGDLDEGELEIGQAAAMLHDIIAAEEIVQNIWKEYCDVNKIKYADND
jgi:enoyl-[acyl-carrier protein] reductase II